MSKRRVGSRDGAETERGDRARARPKTIDGERPPGDRISRACCSSLGPSITSMPSTYSTNSTSDAETLRAKICNVRRVTTMSGGGALNPRASGRTHLSAHNTSPPAAGAAPTRARLPLEFGMAVNAGDRCKRSDRGGRTLASARRKGAGGDDSRSAPPFEAGRSFGEPCESRHREITCRRPGRVRCAVGAPGHQRRKRSTTLSRRALVSAADAMAEGKGGVFMRSGKNRTQAPA